ncbi:acyl-coenzyme A:6-aminopenicillanic acid acyl-transferase-domain-containing protein [Calycina marina]|uniref:Acyl-coenzyme A:6-aminopenicillanic acid acyl-transferase-domain-containing protein n=1 Tax=Calycina marina TaxID=1763456 RepID=A0A9P7Z244_9HELO|nr:acyl-coenzyme A:6-aminopenicillanic acid acyl-transferase-domain-containing protein [Calycina marina]
MSWPEILQETEKYVEPLEQHYPRYFEEIRGIAAGAGLQYLDVLALNVRTEISFGLFSDTAKKLDVPSDGCTALGWLIGGESFLAQNWDWMIEQSYSLVVCHVSQPGTDIPDFSMVTEAGIIGKIGMNSMGVGTLLNAIRCRGVDRSKMPTHFALRKVLESGSREEAVATIKSTGIAGSGHILVGDPTGSTGLECTSNWVKELVMDSQGRVCHSNHLVLEHSDVDEAPWLADSPERLARIKELTSGISESSSTTIFNVFKDTLGFPASIDRKTTGTNTTETLFNIVMNLSDKSVTVTVGRPSGYSEQLTWSFGQKANGTISV